MNTIKDNLKRLTFFLILALPLACGQFSAEILPPTPDMPSETDLPTTTDSPTATVEPTPSEPQISFESAIYRDEEAGFELSYPVGWFEGYSERQSRGYFSQLVSWDMAEGESLDNLPDGESTLQILVALWSPENDLDAYIRQHRGGWEGAGGVVLEEEEIRLEGDHRAVWFLVRAQDDSQYFVFYTETGTRYLVLNGSGDMALMAEIVRTVRVFDRTE